MSCNQPYRSLIVGFSIALSLAGAALGKTDSTGVAIVPATGTSAPGKSPVVSKSCDELKAEIEGKLKAKGVKAFTLNILAKADVKSEKVVGSCEAGAKKIVYKKG